MNDYLKIIKKLKQSPKTWLITGVAGFIGSNIAKSLLSNNQNVIGLDNFITGKQENIADFEDSALFTFIDGDTRDLDACVESCKSVDYVLHHAAIGSVPMSIKDPVLTDEINNRGLINILLAAKVQKVKRVIYASSSAVYGEDGRGVKKNENDVLAPMSPYAASKCANEHYAASLSNTHNIEAIGLRYFNIYGPRQDPDGAYAAVIPKWIDSMLSDKDVEVYGDGTTIRDFCYVGDVVQANILAATLGGYYAGNQIFNVASGCVISLKELFVHLKELTNFKRSPVYKDFRDADIKVSMADISKSRDVLHFEPVVSVKEGLGNTVSWYKGKLNVQ